MFGFFLLDFLAYLLLAVLASYIAVRIAKSRSATKRIKIATGAIAFFAVWLIPFWDWLPTVVYHKYLCNSEAGVKIYRSVEGVEGFFDGGSWPISIGYQYAYLSDNLGGYIRIRRDPSFPTDKRWLAKEIKEPVSEPPLYGAKFEQIKLGKWNAWKLVHTVYVIKTGEVLATFTDFGSTAADPNVPMSEWRKPWLSGRSCFHPAAQSAEAGGPIRTEMLKDMLLRTLKPLPVKN